MAKSLLRSMNTNIGGRKKNMKKLEHKPKIDSISEEERSNSSLLKTEIKTSLQDSEENELENLSSSMSEIIIKIREKKTKGIKDNVREMEKQILYHQGYGRYIKTNMSSDHNYDEDSHQVSGNNQKFRNLKHFQLTPKSSKSKVDLVKRQQNSLYPTNGLKDGQEDSPKSSPPRKMDNREEDFSSESISSHGSKDQKRFLKIPSVKLKRFDAKMLSNENDISNKTSPKKKKKIMMNKYATIRGKNSKFKAISQRHKTMTKFNDAIQRMSF